MPLSGINQDIFAADLARLNAIKNSAVTDSQVQSQAQVKMPEIKDTFEKKDKSNDGKFSFWEFGKNIAKGTVQFFTDIAKNVIKNPITSLVTLGIAGAMACTPLGLMILSGMGLAAVLFGGLLIGIKSAVQINKGQWDDLEKQGKEIGKLIPASLISAFGAFKGANMMSKAIKAKDSIGWLHAARKTIELDARVGWAFIKNVGGTIKTAVPAMIKNPKRFFAWDAFKELWSFRSNVKTGYKGAIKGLNEKLFTKQERKYLLGNESKWVDFNFTGFTKVYPVPLKELGDT